MVPVPRRLRHKDAAPGQPNYTGSLCLRKASRETSWLKATPVLRGSRMEDKEFKAIIS